MPRGARGKAPTGHAQNPTGQGKARPESHGARQGKARPKTHGARQGKANEQNEAHTQRHGCARTCGYAYADERRQQTLAHRRAAHFSHGMLRQTPELKHFASRVATFNERHGDSTPTLLLLKQPQPPSLGLSTLGEKLSWPIRAPVNLFGN